MPDSKKTPRKKTVAAKTRPSESESSAAPADFGDIQLQYARATEQIFPETQGRYGEAYNRFVAALQDVQSDLLQGGMEAYRALVTQLNEAFGSDELHARCTDAYENYTNLLYQLWDQSDTQRQSAEAYRTFLSTLNEASAHEDAQKRSADAYLTCVEQMKRAWDKSDIYQQTKEAHKTYLQALLEVQAEGQNKAGEACKRFDDALREVAARVDAAPRSEAAMRSYATALEETWRDAQKAHTQILASALQTAQESWEKTLPPASHA